MQCSDDSDDSSTPVEATFDSLWANGLNTCGSCHNGVDPDIEAADPNVSDLSTRESFEALKTATHDNAAAGCTYLDSTPQNSSIAQSVIDYDDKAPCENYSYNTHAESGAIPTAEGFAVALESWLQQGAPF